MKYIKNILLFYLSLSCFCSLSYGQKATLNFDTYKSWSEVKDGGISNNGKFAFYQIQNIPIAKNTFVLKSLTDTWKIEIAGLKNPKFSQNSTYLIGVLPNDTLLLFNLKNNKEMKLSGIRNYGQICIRNTELLVLQGSNGDLRLNDFAGKQLWSYSNVSQYKFSPDNRKLFIEQTDILHKGHKVGRWINLITKKEKVIYNDLEINNLVFDDRSEQAAFMITVHDSSSIYYYKEGKEKAELLADNRSPGIKNGFTIEGGEYWSFSKDGERIMFSLKQDGVIDTGMSSKFEIWSYQDVNLKSQYYDRSGKLKNRPANHYLSTIRISDHVITQLLHGDERVIYETLKHETDTVCLVQSSFGEVRADWNLSQPVNYRLCFTKTGATRRFDTEQKVLFDHISISPKGKFIIYFDSQIKQYICYEITNSRKYIISSTMGEDVFRAPELDLIEDYKYSVGIAGWTKDDEAVIVKGAYDIYIFDPRNKKAPVNLTQGIGKKERIIFNLIQHDSNDVVNLTGKILLSAFDQKNKDFGFYKVSFEGSKYVQKLSMNSMYCGSLDMPYSALSPADFMKASNAEVYLLRNEKANQAPNYFISRHLTTFSRISDIQPQKSYQWMTSELHTYRDSLGREYQGILYKPESFDENKNYPIIFHYYECKSNQLNKFISVELPSGNLSIPMFISNGYLVFLPDLHGSGSSYPGEGVLRSIIAAADHLKQYSYIDQRRMGILGSSFAGYHTNYIVTHTNRFAAAVSMCGISNLTTLVTSIRGGNIRGSIVNQYLRNQEKYIKDSPIFYAQNITAPLLLVHNRGDLAVDYLQSQSFFLMLRALEKKVWWISYKDEDHGITDSSNILDYHQKVLDFFNYYLKKAQQPDWMKEFVKSGY